MSFSKENGEKILTWNIWYSTIGFSLPVIQVEAATFDDALEIARKVDRRYDTGQIESRQDLYNL